MLYERLVELEKNGTPITVGIIGAGTFGSQIISQTCQIKGMRISAVADLKRERATRALHLGGIASERIQSAKSSADINEAIDKNRPVSLGDVLEFDEIL
jgi:predicted homoserine dehydrogenase-like protein